MAANDVLTPAEARVAIGRGSNDTTEDTPLTSMVTAVSEYLDSLVGPIVQRTVTDELHDGGYPEVFLRHYPVSSVTSATEYNGTTATALTVETNSSHPADGCRLDSEGRTGVLLRRSSGGTTSFPDGMGNVKVTYVAGRYASTSAVADRYKEAARIMLAMWWSRRDVSATLEGEYDVPAQRWPGFALPNAVRQLLGDEWRRSAVVR